MIPCRIQSLLEVRLAESPVVALLGPRQVGKTTLAMGLAAGCRVRYLDLEAEVDRARLADPALYLADHENDPVILDEVHRLPDLFLALRGLVDAGRRMGLRAADDAASRRWRLDFIRDRLGNPAL